MCTILYDIIKTLLLSLPVWHTRLFTDSIHNICWILHRGNRRRIRLCNCLLTRCAYSKATAVIQRALSKHMKCFSENSYCACATGKVVLTRKANVWKRRSFLTFLPCFEYCTTGQTAVHFRQVTCCAKNSHPLFCFCVILDYHAQIAQCTPPNLSLNKEANILLSIPSSHEINPPLSPVNNGFTMIDVIH